MEHSISRRRTLQLFGLGSGLALVSPLLLACSPAQSALPTAPAAGPTAKPSPAANVTKATPTSSIGYAPSAKTTPVPTAPAFANIAADARDPLKVEANAQVDAEYFSGGSGIDFLIYLDRLFEKLHPGTKVNEHFIQREQEQLQPRFIAGSPPDVVFNGGAGDLNVASLVTNGQLLDLAPVLDAPSLDTPGKTVKETLVAGSQLNGQYGGKQYALEFVSHYNGIWHSSSLFKKKGWTVPNTWTDMITFCKQLKKEGMNPWTYQGIYPQYMNTLLDAMVFHQGGWNALLAIDNLEPNAWKQPAVQNALDAMYELAANDFFMPGTSGLTHTQSQAEWLKGDAVFIPCGSWLEREMLSLIPNGFDMVAQTVPSLSGDKEPTTAIEGAFSGDFIVPTKAKNPQAGLEICRLLLSKTEAQFFASDVLSAMPVQGVSYDQIKSTAFLSVADLVNQAKGNVFSLNYALWYAKLQTEEKDQMGALLTKQIKPAEFMDKVQKVADATAKDPSITKFQRVRPTA